jgi:hypothetical protein
MGSVQVELDQDLVDLLEELHRRVKQAAREAVISPCSALIALVRSR